MVLELARRVEDASLRAWPALETEDLDGWELRASSGFTKRANSVQPFNSLTCRISEKVSYCETWYADRGLSAIFRLTPFSEPELDWLLAERAYQRVEPTDVLVTGLPISEGLSSSAEFVQLELEEWLQTYGMLRHNGEVDLSCLRAIIGACGQRRSLGALAVRSHGNVACGLGVIDKDLVGLFDLVTAQSYRRRGYGAALLDALLDWGSGHGARWAYLQVARSNVPAKALYEKRGFETAYTYWYRVRPDPV